MQTNPRLQKFFDLASDFGPKPAATQPECEPSRGGRRSFLRGATLAAAAIPAALVTATPAAAQIQDNAENRERFVDIQRHENLHVIALEFFLGDNARPEPTFKDLQTFDYEEFLKLAQTFENVGVGAYLGAVPFIADPDVLEAAGSIALIEARHAGFLNTFQETRITQNVFRQEQAFERVLTAASVRNLAGPFIADLNGGPPLFYTQGNDIQIMNFALALEYLEREFYNLNVPYFFPA